MISPPPSPLEPSEKEGKWVENKDGTKHFHKFPLIGPIQRPPPPPTTTPLPPTG